jgi:hypothetical protein
MCRTTGTAAAQSQSDAGSSVVARRSIGLGSSLRGDQKQDDYGDYPEKSDFHLQLFKVDRIKAVGDDNPN